MPSEKVEYKTVWCKYKFSPDELRDIAEVLAIKTQDKNALEGEKKSVMSSYKERIESVDVEIISAARKYKDRYEMKDIECFIERDFEEGVVRYIRTDNGEIAQTSKMTMADRQMHVDQAIKDNQEAILKPIQDLHNSLGPGEYLTIEGGGRSVTLTDEKTNEEIRRQQDLSRVMSSETSVL